METAAGVAAAAIQAVEAVGSAGAEAIATAADYAATPVAAAVADAVDALFGIPQPGNLDLGSIASSAADTAAGALADLAAPDAAAAPGHLRGEVGQPEPGHLECCERAGSRCVPAPCGNGPRSRSSAQAPPTPRHRRLCTLDGSPTDTACGGERRPDVPLRRPHSREVARRTRHGTHLPEHRLPAAAGGSGSACRTAGSAWTRPTRCWRPPIQASSPGFAANLVVTVGRVVGETDLDAVVQRQQRAAGIGAQLERQDHEPIAGRDAVWSASTYAPTTDRPVSFFQAQATLLVARRERVADVDHPHRDLRGDLVGALRADLPRRVPEPRRRRVISRARRPGRSRPGPG